MEKLLKLADDTFERGDFEKADTLYYGIIKLGSPPPYVYYRRYLCTGCRCCIEKAIAGALKGFQRIAEEHAIGTAEHATARFQVDRILFLLCKTCHIARTVELSIGHPIFPNALSLLGDVEKNAECYEEAFPLLDEDGLYGEALHCLYSLAKLGVPGAVDRCLEYADLRNVQTYELVDLFPHRTEHSVLPDPRTVFELDCLYKVGLSYFNEGQLRAARLIFTRCFCSRVVDDPEDCRKIHFLWALAHTYTGKHHALLRDHVIYDE